MSGVEPSATVARAPAAGRGARRTRRAVVLGIGAALVAVGLTRLVPKPPTERVPRVARVEDAVRGLEQRYGIAVRFADPSRFVTAPYDTLPSTIGATPMAADAVPVALALVERGLSLYPPDFVRRTLGGVFLCDQVTTFGRRAGGLVFLSGVYLPGPEIVRSAGARREFVLTLHHELSSLTLARGTFPREAWERLLPPGFRFPEGRAAELAALDTVDDAAQLAAAHDGGFVNGYGRTSLENDFNTFAETAFGDPDEMARLATTFPSIRAKLALFIAFHESLDPAFHAVFERLRLRTASVAARQAS